MGCGSGWFCVRRTRWGIFMVGFCVHRDNVFFRVLYLLIRFKCIVKLQLCHVVLHEITGVIGKQRAKITV